MNLLKDSPRVAILGAGPTGLGAAYRFYELGLEGFTVYEAEDFVGGLAASFVDQNGFTWDVGGHVQFSHYRYFDNLMDTLLGEDWISHERESWVWICDRFIPYPFQYNIGSLPVQERDDCLRGLLRIAGNKSNGTPGDFHEWILGTFGEGIARHFMVPYNFKVWAYPPEMLSYTWVGERVAQIDLERVVFNILNGQVEKSWGPNNMFRFPLRGGTGQIWRALASRLPSGTVQSNKRMISLDTARKTLQFDDGTRESYDVLISTIPLDQLLSRSDLRSLRPLAERLLYSSVHVVGVGLKGTPPPHLRQKCWMYFPEETSPFYRATVFSNYSPNNVPDASNFWSLMLEVSESPVKSVDRNSIVESVLRGLVATRLIESTSDVVSTWHYVAPHGYPTPFVGRDSVVNPILEQLELVEIHSRGRFGAWKYEVSNQDHSLMQGVELANRLVNGDKEVTVFKPEIVNGNRYK